MKFLLKKMSKSFLLIYIMIKLNNCLIVSLKEIFHKDFIVFLIYNILTY